MIRHPLAFALAACAALGLVPAAASAQPAAPKAQPPVLVTSCGQSPGPLKITVFLKRLGVEHEYKPDATAQDVASNKFKTLIVVTGASLKGMGAAGVSIKDELARTTALLDAAKKAGVLIVGSHIEGMARRAQGAEAGDTSDEQSIDAVCPRSQVLVIRKDGDADGRFTAIAKKQGIPMIAFEKNLDIEGVMKSLFGR
ncbi:MAG TPA: DUF6305 family protein [Vicinamibacterales bacterium]|nr:DUF6305 family protein [Vicinamibacterales bacterium]HOG28283.1 DUF6305 family protein [Vicinamibacterales bacterium]HOQ62200.1 DUF6305 family protein [Vicinamibacterales bacterium]HPK71468.1 DUF6305 family protein [Vicinamibacterales bacterium]HPW19883.1 DUF6305 family protein [Vicinamibacterales bacterium]